MLACSASKSTLESIHSGCPDLQEPDEAEALPLPACFAWQISLETPHKEKDPKHEDVHR